MAFSTSFEHVERTTLPLPHPKKDETYESIAERGMEIALGLLHDNDYMMNLSPLHMQHEELPASADQAVNVEQLAQQFSVALTEKQGEPRVNGGPDWRHYEITDQVPVIGAFTTQLVFRTALRNIPSGMESLSDPGNTVTIYGKWEVMRTPGDPTTLTLLECQTTNCNLFLSWYIRSTLGDSHAEIHKTVKAKFVEEMQK